MNNYLMFNQIVKCNVLPKSKVRKDLFKNWNRPFISSVKKHKLAHNQNKTPKAESELLKKRLQRVENMKSLLLAKGIKYEPVIVNKPAKNFENLSKQKSKEQKQQHPLYHLPPLVLDAIKSRTTISKQVSSVSQKLSSAPKKRMSMLKKRRQLIVWKYVKLQAAAKKNTLVRFE